MCVCVFVSSLPGLPHWKKPENYVWHSLIQKRSCKGRKPKPEFWFPFEVRVRFPKFWDQLLKRKGRKNIDRCKATEKSCCSGKKSKLKDSHNVEFTVHFEQRFMSGYIQCCATEQQRNIRMSWNIRFIVPIYNPPPVIFILKIPKITKKNPWQKPAGGSWPWERWYILAFDLDQIDVDTHTCHLFRRRVSRRAHKSCPGCGWKLEACKRWYTYIYIYTYIWISHVNLP